MFSAWVPYQCIGQKGGTPPLCVHVQVIERLGPSAETLLSFHKNSLLQARWSLCPLVGTIVERYGFN